MHPTQKDILESLRRVDRRRFGELLWEIGETSDNLTYHLKQLQKTASSNLHILTDVDGIFAEEMNFNGE